MKRRISFALVVAVLGLAAAVLVFHLVGFRSTWAELRKAGLPALGAMVAVTLLWLTFQAAAWEQLSRPVGHHVPFHSLLGGILVGFAGNFLTPSMYVGGEPLRVAYVGSRRRLPYYQVAGTVILAKYLEFMAFVLMMVVGTGVTVVYYWNELATAVQASLAFGMLLLVAAFALLLTSLLGKRRPISALANWLVKRRLFGRPLRRVRRRVRQMEDQISTTVHREGSYTWSAFIWLTLGFLTMFVRPLVFFIFLKGTDAKPVIFNFHELCLMFVLTQFLLAFQITPGSLGSYDAGTIGIMALVGISKEQAAAFVICTRAADVVVLSVAITVAMRQGVKIWRLVAASKAANVGTGAGLATAAKLTAENAPPGASSGAADPSDGSDASDRSDDAAGKPAG